ncbi:nuclear transport factor 2 family protein [Arthrobacter gengyunqii]|uniref:Nuclear transport factor 2 family protein n=1 Tax=Arthrobacter gengyunqii TaxID=2886940 RepID=A0A9X1M0Z7_9MICC|nr:nuclear transport factor 2 family protein [Arthrobacter gengyunqii]MCC3269313.1 nuclear transport factor 2 family protein [Arthrobacter gengyunqii]UOY94740.1 nuclear transport factor 2 family protein [Arthrobacter gengyunqii]
MNTAPHFHDDYMAAWNEAMASGDSAPIEAFLSPDYHGWLGHVAAMAHPFDGDAARKGFLDAVSGMRGSTVHAAFRTVAPRGPDEAVVCYEMTYRSGPAVTGRALLMESWQLADNRWTLRRDFTEVNIGEPAAQQ